MKKVNYYIATTILILCAIIFLPLQLGYRFLDWAYDGKITYWMNDFKD